MVAAGGAFVCGDWCAQHQGPVAGMAVAVAVGFVVGVITPVLAALQQIGRVKDVWGGSVLCTVSEDAWSFRMPSGVRTEVPWQAMRLLFEHPDGWIIHYDQVTMIVFRSPLKAAGLDEEFRKRLQHNGRG